MNTNFCGASGLNRLELIKVLQLARSARRGAGLGRILGVGCSRGAGVGRGVAVGVDVAVGVEVAVAVAVAVGAGVAVGVAVGSAVAVGEGVGAGVVVGVGVPLALCTSNEPISSRPFATRSKPEPRWSKKGGGVKAGSPALTAGLPGNSACVNVGPPLSCNGPSIGSMLVWSPGPVKKPAASSLLKL